MTPTRIAPSRNSGNEVETERPIAEVAPWGRETLPYARDGLFVVAIAFAAIGFVYHAAKQMAQAPAGPGDQRLGDLLGWGAEAIAAGPVVYGTIAGAFLGLALLATFVKRRFGGAPLGRSLFYTILVLGFGIAVLGSTVVAWNQGFSDASGDLAAFSGR